MHEAILYHEFAGLEDMRLKSFGRPRIPLRLHPGYKGCCTNHNFRILSKYNRKPSTAELNDSARAQLFAQFNTLERSGIPLLQSLPIISKQAPAYFQEKLQRLFRFVQAGHPLASGGRNSGLFLPWEARVIAAAEAAGELQTVFAQFAEHYQSRFRRFSKLKVRLLYPFAVLIIGVLVLPLPELVKGSIGPMGYFLRTLFPLALFFLSIRLLVSAYRRSLAGEQEDMIAAFMFRAPLLRRQLQCEMLALLALLLRTGVPAIEALELVRDCCTNPLLTEKFIRALDSVRNGMNVTEALAAADLLEDEYAPGLIGSGEFAGRLDAMLDYYVARLREKLQAQLDLWAEWLPRVAYFVIVGFLLLGIF